jgi:hypothetical protein
MAKKRNPDAETVFDEGGRRARGDSGYVTWAMDPALGQEEPARHVHASGAQLRRSRQDRGRVGAGGRDYRRDEEAGWLRQLPGGVSRATGSLTTVSTWKTEDAAKLPVREVMGDVLDRLEVLGVEVKSVDTYEVTWSV